MRYFLATHHLSGLKLASPLVINMQIPYLSQCVQYIGLIVEASRQAACAVGRHSHEEGPWAPAIAVEAYR